MTIDRLLLEDGTSFLLLENGTDKLLLESSNSTHDSTGALIGPGSTIVGSARNKAQFPELISTVEILLGTSATPGAKSVTVPADAQLVIIHGANYNASGAALSLASSFAGAFTVVQDTIAGGSVFVAYAVVSATGAQTLTPTWTNACTEGPLFYVSFVKGVNTGDFLRDAKALQNSSNGPTASFVLTTNSSDLVLLLDKQDSSPPGGMGNCTLVYASVVNLEAGRLQTYNTPGAATTTLTTVSTNFAGLSAISIKPNSGPVTHTSSGALTGQIGSIAGAAQHYTLHGSTGALTGPGSALSGAASRSASGVTHTATGALTGPGSTIAGAAKRFRAFSASGALSGPGAAVAGTALRYRAFTASGVLSGAGAAIVGSANRFRSHDATGAITGPGSAVSGSASRSTGAVTHTSSGALTGPGSAIAGAANRFRAFSASGALSGPGAVVAGTALRYRAFTSSGALSGAGASVVGAANRFRAHGTSGAITGPGSAISGTAQHNVPHSTSGALVGAGSQVSGSATRFRAHDATGALVGPGSIITGSSSLPGAVTHASSGALNGPGSVIAGVSARYRQMAASGALSGPGSAIAGSATLNRPHSTTGAIVGPGSSVAGVATRSGGAITITFDQLLMIADVWQRLGLNPAAPLTETEAAAVAGTLSLAKTGALVTTRTGASDPGDLTAMLLDVWQRLGLDPSNPMTATDTTIAAGGVSQALTPTAGGVVVTRA